MQGNSGSNWRAGDVLIVVAPGAAAGVRIPNGSVGWKKLTPQVRKRIAGNAGAQGPQGPAGLPGAPGATGLTGPQGEDAAAEVVLTYSVKLGAQAGIIPPPPPQPLVLHRENGATQESIGPLTFYPFCESEGEDTIRGRLVVEANQGGIVLNGKPLEPGDLEWVQHWEVSSSGPGETFPNVIRATTADGAFAFQMVASLYVSLPDGGCNFYGTLIEDS
jgi:hypothetical protein